MGPSSSWFQRYEPGEFRVSYGSPCMVEIYNQDNWVLFMLDSHGAEPCDRRFGSAVKMQLKCWEEIAQMNGLQYVEKRCFSSKTSTWVSHETTIVANRGTSLIRLSHGERAVNGSPANMGLNITGIPPGITKEKVI